MPPLVDAQTANSKWPFGVRLGFFVLAIAVAFGGLYWLKERRLQFMSPYRKEIATFRAEAEERLRSPGGWLSVVGLSWIRPGENKIGSAPNAEVKLPASVSAQLGVLTFAKREGPYQLVFQETAGVTVDEKPAVAGQVYELNSDKSPQPTMIKAGSVSFFLIDRKNGVGVRVKDTEAPARRDFKGRDWYPPREDFRIEAEWVAHPVPRRLQVPDILGNLNDEVSPGFARFQHDGKMIELHPTQDGDSLFFVFRDETAGKETYGASRFLYADLATNGKIILDFNKAVNPPCAFTAFATCPMPPNENLVHTSLAAGELKPRHPLDISH